MEWAIVALGVALASLGATVWLAMRVGTEAERAEQARQEAEDADEQARRLAGPMPTQEDRQRAAERVLRERGARVPDDAS